MDWIKSNTFHHSQFNIDELERKKKDLNISISLCIPTLNEAETIGSVVSILRHDLMDQHNLIDEIAVIDSGSQDETLSVAKRCGADIYQACDILSEYGHYRGKGENLWKAVYQLRGDILVYIDGDIKNIHARFVYGLIGPLLNVPEISYVKGFYRRPLIESSKMMPTGGGRVTEILIRPLFSMFFPELSKLVQPLSGEYAVRRKVLENISFPVGYGVETSHLIDVYKNWGMRVLAQTDLDSRIHRNQSAEALGKMSFEILQTFFSRIRSLDIIGDLPRLSTTLNQFAAEQEGYCPVKQEIKQVERSPMVNFVPYQKKFGSKVK